MQINIRHTPFYNFLTILRSSVRVPFFYSSGPCTVPAKFFPAFLLISFVSATFYFKERYVTLYLYYICRVFRLAQPDALFSQAAAPAARRRMSAVFRSASADHVSCTFLHSHPLQACHEPVVRSPDAAGLVPDAAVRSHALFEQQQCFGYFYLPCHYRLHRFHRRPDGLLVAV